jgi:hypothetical protein
VRLGLGGTVRQIHVNEFGRDLFIAIVVQRGLELLRNRAALGSL